MFVISEGVELRRKGKERVYWYPNMNAVGKCRMSPPHEIKCAHRKTSKGYIHHARKHEFDRRTNKRKYCIRLPPPRTWFLACSIMCALRDTTNISIRLLIDMICNQRIHGSSLPRAWHVTFPIASAGPITTTPRGVHFILMSTRG
jgi:hypothetical protein